VPVDGEATDPRFLDLIRDEIRSSGPLSFARFMELALYDSTFGYYAAGSRRLGPGGDFFTASDTGRAFGRCLARQIAEIDRAAGPFDPFHVVEFGCGRGLLARDILDAVIDLEPELSPRLRYVLADRSKAMRDAAARLVPEAQALAPDELREVPGGCVLAVELFDALPVHRVRRRGETLVEVFVDVDERGNLVEHEDHALPGVEDWADRYGAAAEEGTEAEVALPAASQLDALAGAIARGVILVVDYGCRSEKLYSPERRRGTLLAYHGHQTNERFFERVGGQDLTAHVNFSALEDRAQRCGMSVLGLTTQDRFLIANGILEEFEQRDLRESHDPRRVKRRMQAMQLIHPSGMGRSFRVLALSKRCDPQPALAGLSDPF